MKCPFYSLLSFWPFSDCWKRLTRLDSGVKHRRLRSGTLHTGDYIKSPVFLRSSYYKKTIRQKSCRKLNTVDSGVKHRRLRSDNMHTGIFRKVLASLRPLYCKCAQARCGRIFNTADSGVKHRRLRPSFSRNCTDWHFSVSMQCELVCTIFHTCITWST